MNIPPSTCGRSWSRWQALAGLCGGVYAATFMNQTAGPEWKLGRARLNGYNGMTRIPSQSVAWFDGHRIRFDGANFHYLALGLLVVTYLASRILVNSLFGNVLVASRENPERAELLGYDVRRYQLGAFTIGGFLAALSGALYAAWGNFIAPTSMALPAAAMPIIWLAVGGWQDITATLIGTFVVLYVFQLLTVVSQQYALVATRMMVAENLQVGEMVGGRTQAKLYDLVYEFFPTLKDRRDQKAGTMSGGQQQQLAIGRAMIGNPDLLLLDEPSEGIQPSIVEDISRVMRGLNRELGTTVLFVEQNLDMILSLAQRCYVMDKGRTVAERQSHELQDRKIAKRDLQI